jgi:hypothetical protein
MDTAQSSLSVMWSGYEAKHSPLSSAKVVSKVKNEWSYIFMLCVGKTLPLPFTVKGMAYNSELF